MEHPQGYGLRPRTIGELLDLTFRIYRRRFTVFAPIGALITVSSLVPSLLFQSLFAFTIGSAEQTATPSLEILAFALALPVLILAFLVLYSFGTMAITSAVDDEFFGRPVALRSALANARARTLAAAGTSVLCSILTLFGALLCCLPGIGAMIVLILAVPVVLLEGRSPSSAIERSWQLMVRRGPLQPSMETSWLRAIIVGFAMFVIYYILIILSQLPIFAVSLISLFRAGQPTQTILGPQLVPLSILLPLQVVCAAVQGLFFAIMVIPWPLLYYDIRTRYEGLDLERAAESLAMPGGTTGALAEE